MATTQTISAILLLLLSFSCGSSDSFLKAENTPPPAFNDRTLNRVTFLTAHNAFANNGDDARFLVPNQEWGITKPMEMGICGFMPNLRISVAKSS